jgi:leucyl/phenylalanyl-tRNA---protein transferase
MRHLQWLDPHGPIAFPPPESAFRDPNGLLAAGGDLSPERLVHAYQRGIFPWFSDGQPILWWSPDPRTVLYPQRFHLSRSLRKRAAAGDDEVTLDRAFAAVMRGCAAPRRDQGGTWINDPMLAAYQRLFELGIAHSVEVWREQRLIGGVYGLAMGAVFFGESMFSAERDASKLALLWLTGQLSRWGYALIDCQVSSAHLLSIGAEEMRRRQFLELLHEAVARPGRPAPWSFDADFYPLAGAAPSGSR